jgi:hypothetical protein
MAVMMKICDQTKIEPKLENKTLVDDRHFENLAKLSPEFLFTYFRCGTQLALLDDVCRDMLSQVLTDEGICYSFNIFAPHELYHEEV